MNPAPPLRLRIDLDALAANWRWFQREGRGGDCGAAVKANGYGLGAREVAARLYREGCRTFYVATWGEAASLGPVGEGARVKVLHGVLPDEIETALALPAQPVLNSAEQLRLWREAGGERPCDVMIDTGMNRLGIDWREVGPDMLRGLRVGTVHSHLACADEPENPMNPTQLERFRSVLKALGDPKAGIANSGGLCLGADYALQVSRPGLGLYGGVPNSCAAGEIRQVVRPEARVLQVRTVPAGDTAGYGATWTAARETRLAALNVGYADGYLRSFSGRGEIIVGDVRCPVVGRVSMDLVIADVSAAPDLGVGDWAEIAYALPEAAAVSGLSQYELLTGLGSRYSRAYL
jgi:alanine racemase